MKTEKILVVDDEINIARGICEALGKEGYRTLSTSNGLKALEEVREDFFHLIIADVKMPGMSGLEFLRQVKRECPETMVVILTAYGTIETAVEAMREGAYDYLSKPIDIKRLRALVEKALEKQRLILENQILRQKLEGRTRFDKIVGKGEKIREIYRLVERVADTKSTVLIQGESGTGKELIARAIHEHSSRCRKPFITLNCAALPENLLESELFGHEKGAFTGALARKTGRFEEAEGGTLFLDEVGGMSPKMQMDLLRVVEERRLRRVGGSEMIEVDARLIAATNTDLKKAVENGSFRKDLYYRLNVIPILLPPLRERKEDIPTLAKVFLAEFNKENNKDVKIISPQAMEAMVNYHWPGNIRELKNVMERAIILAPGDNILSEYLPSEIQEKIGQPGRVSLALGTTLKEAEKKLIEQTLKEITSHREEAARLLGISVRSLHYKMKEYGIEY
ncbi:MAG: sigma-54-dependent Fis family transcriptional regulator [Nitrospirae bacterium]|nr:sigma-54-dependent Fis family transcriptional regulator [Nitrospirota bacterium]